MKRFAISAAALLLLLPGESAQGQVTLTLAVGPNIATLARVEGRESWSQLGGGLGVTVGLPVSDDWGIQLGVGTSDKGYHREYPPCGGVGPHGCVVSSGIYLNYLESTVLADRRFELDNRVLLHLLAGPFLAYQFDPEPQRAKAFDFGVAGGAQLEMGLYGKLGLSVATLYTHGLRNIRETTLKTRTLTLRAGLSYSIG